MQNIVQITIVVDDYDKAIEYYTSTLRFVLIEDTQLTDTKRWVVIAPPGSTNGFKLLLAKAANEEQEKFIGRQTGGRVFLFLHTDNFLRDYNSLKASGVHFVREPSKEEYGTVAVFQDMYGNLWDLIEPGVFRSNA
jgi:catechol 2,3-dioxygenase-like lactoylglutathione lyase family enzyme